MMLNMYMLNMLNMLNMEHVHFGESTGLRQLAIVHLA